MHAIGKLAGTVSKENINIVKELLKQMVIDENIKFSEIRKTRKEEEETESYSNEDALFLLNFALTYLIRYTVQWEDNLVTNKEFKKYFILNISKMFNYLKLLEDNYV